jgi:hypothetical protein
MSWYKPAKLADHLLPPKAGLHALTSSLQAS